MLKLLRQRLTAKFVAGNLSGLLLVSFFFLLVFISVYRYNLHEEQAGAAARVGRLLESAIATAMLSGRPHDLQPLINSLAQEADVHRVWIMDPEGRISFSNDPGDRGRQYDAATTHGCRQCHAAQLSTASTLLFTDERHQEILRAAQPIPNRPACGKCHEAVDKQPNNGILLVDYDGAGVQKDARTAALLFVAAGIVVFLITVVGGAWFMHRFVLRPLRELHRASTQMAAGDLDARTEIPGNDEFSALATCFNTMADTVQKQMGALNEKKTFLQALVDAVPDGLRVIDEDFSIELANAAYRRQQGLAEEQIEGNTCYSSSHRRDSPCPATMVRCPVQELSAGGEPFKSLHRHKLQDGSEFDVEIFASPMETKKDGVPRRMIVESIRDLKEQVRFSHEQKLSELGQLAAGVAHEIYNPLSAAKMKLDSTMHRLTVEQLDQNELHASLELVDAEIARCTETADRLLKLSRFSGSTAMLVDVNIAVADTLSLLNQEATEKNIKVSRHLSEDAPRALINESEFRLVVLNLAQNAFHAMPEGGDLVVVTEKEAGQVRIIVEDNGVGIPENIMTHIFEPFFSRRASDTAHGAGLGLSISQANIRRQGGEITATSSVGKGSRFVVSLPDPDSP
ncbi:MAG: ATP-binding protein, partial [Pseudomonadota bacterium]